MFGIRHVIQGRQEEPTISKHATEEAAIGALSDFARELEKEGKRVHVGRWKVKVERQDRKFEFYQVIELNRRGIL